MNFASNPSGMLVGGANSRLVGWADRSAQANKLALIDGSTLGRECFVRTMETAHPKLRVFGYGSIAEWKRASDDGEPSGAVLYNIGARKASSEAVGAELRELSAEAGSTPVIVLAESADLREIIAAVDCGARGYIPASVGVDVMVEATRLTSAGGVFLPSATVLSMRHSVEPRDAAPKGLGETFTSRQAAVAEALRRGKANKIIAYELNMCESTVKVHIRNIMKKLRATNRTEAAFKLNSMAGSQASGDSPRGA